MQYSPFKSHVLKLQRLDWVVGSPPFLLWSRFYMCIIISNLAKRFQYLSEGPLKSGPWVQTKINKYTNKKIGRLSRTAFSVYTVPDTSIKQRAKWAHAHKGYYWVHLKPHIFHMSYLQFTHVFFQYYTGLSVYGFKVQKIFGVFPMMHAWLYEWAYIGTCS